MLTCHGQNICWASRKQKEDTNKVSWICLYKKTGSKEITHLFKIIISIMVSVWSALDRKVFPLSVYFSFMH